MKVKHEKITYSFCGDVYHHYIRKVKKHWWSPWRIVMDGNIPARYDLIDGEYIHKI